MARIVSIFRAEKPQALSALKSVARIHSEDGNKDGWWSARNSARIGIARSCMELLVCDGPDQGCIGLPLGSWLVRARTYSGYQAPPVAVDR
jgi:hypothetical protein